MDKAIIKVNGLYYSSILPKGKIEWTYLIDEAQVIDGFDNIQETITTITEMLEDGEKTMNIELIYPDETKSDVMTTGELQGSEIIH